MRIIKRLLSDRIGEVNLNNYGNRMVIIKYNKAVDILVQFDNGYIVESDYDSFIKGEISSPYDKRVYGVGYIGEGKYNCINKNRKMTNQYNEWQGMMYRCYSEVFHRKFPTYQDCSVSEKWHSFQNFAKWYDENYYETENENMQLNKDILHKGNKIYSPENCIFVPQYINSLFIKNKKSRGNLPIGVSSSKQTINKYRAYFHCNGKHIYLGTHNTPEKAFEVYKKYKEKFIKQVADEYKSKYPQFPQKLYNAMYRYEVEITD